MDDRQRQIQVGAGLQESRLNTELIGFLQKYGSPLLTAVLVIVLAYVGYSRYHQWQADKDDKAFEQYIAARVGYGNDGVLTGNPDNLLQVAQETDGRRSVWALATLDAADIALASARRGLLPGAATAAPKPEEMLSAEQVREMLKKAESGYQSVLDRVGSNTDMTPLMIRARWGAIATAISLGEFDRAEAALNELIQEAERLSLADQASIAKLRLADLPKFKSPPVFVAAAELPESARAPAPDGLPPGTMQSAPAPIAVQPPFSLEVPPGMGYVPPAEAVDPAATEPVEKTPASEPPAQPQ